MERKRVSETRYVHKPFARLHKVQGAGACRFRNDERCQPSDSISDEKVPSNIRPKGSYSYIAPHSRYTNVMIL